MHRDLTFYTVFVPRIWFQMSGKIYAIAHPESALAEHPKPYAQKEEEEWEKC